MYYESSIPSPKYMRFNMGKIPVGEIQKTYSLDKKYKKQSIHVSQDQENVVCLKESGHIAHIDMVNHLKKHDGYIERSTRHTEGLFTHTEQDISFTLVVDDFSITYKGKRNEDSLAGSNFRWFTM